ncbi:MAG: peptidoglycan-binding protein, partial [Clostridiales bacterium]|nr:peptidoglycan-binding protein [Clostridiales bacterium]
EAVTWESATLRTWLNNDFLNTAFTEQEREVIITSVISNEDNPEYGTDGGPDTQDRVFLLSLAEAEEYLCDDDDRRALNTPYAQAQGAIDVDGFGDWWLRSPGNGSDHASCMFYCDKAWVDCCGYEVNISNCALRPAMFIKLGAGISFGDPGNTPMDIETTTLGKTPASVELNPDGTETAGIFAPEALSGLWMVTTTYESWHGEDGVEKDWNLTWSMPVLLEFQTDGQGTWTEMHEWGTLTGFASMENGTIGVSLQANGPVQYDGKIIINVAEKTMEGTMTEESHTDTSMWTKGPWSAIMVADQSELSDCFRELNVGITGKDVAALKTHLYELGYSPFDPGTDNFIESTGEAVAAFEKRNGLPADGIADPVMQALLYSDFAIPNQR